MSFFHAKDRLCVGLLTAGINRPRRVPIFTKLNILTFFMAIIKKIALYIFLANVHEKPLKLTITHVLQYSIKEISEHV